MTVMCVCVCVLSLKQNTVAFYTLHEKPMGIVEAAPAISSLCGYNSLQFAPRVMGCVCTRRGR